MCIAKESFYLYKLISVTVVLGNVISACFPNENLSRNINSVSWYESWEDATILNVDESVIGNPGIAGFGDRIISYHGHLCVSNILHAELLGIFHGLRNVICCFDSLNALALIKETTPSLHAYVIVLWISATPSARREAMCWFFWQNCDLKHQANCVVNVKRVAL